MTKQTISFDSLPIAVERLNKNVETLIELMTSMSDRISTIEAAVSNQDTPLDVEEASELIKRTKGTLYKMVCNKELPFHKKGNRLFFYKRELMQWLETGLTSATSQPSLDIASADGISTSTLLSTTLDTPADSHYQKLLTKNLKSKQK